VSAVRPDPDGRYLDALLGMRFTSAQLDIITAPLEPQLVIAGAGSGKTMVMAARVVHAVAFYGVSPARVLGLTFTNKAAGELAERVRTSLARLPRDAPGVAVDPDGGDAADDVPTIATYNAYAAQLVRDHALRIGREPGAALLSEAVQWQLAMRVATSAPGPFEHLSWTTPYTAGLIVALAGELSDHLVTAGDVRRHDARVRGEVAALPKALKAAKDLVARTEARDELLGLVASYTAAKQQLDVIDFGDQVALACAIATAAPEVAGIERERYGLVVLDEYQDTGVAQRVLLSTLFAGSHAVTAVGDPNQAIYGWRGASASNLSRFREHFAPGEPPRPPQPLMTSFRCDGRILAAANAVAGPLHASLVAKGRIAIDIPPLLPRDGAETAGTVVVTRTLTAADEADWLADRIAAAVTAAPGETVAATQPGEIAVLARRRTDFARLHRAMVDRGIPVEVVGLGGLLAMPEVSDIVAVLSLLVDVTANAATVRLLTGPRWQIGVRDLAALGARAAALAREHPHNPDAAIVADSSVDVAETTPGADSADTGSADTDSADTDPLVSAGLDDVLRAATASVDPVEVPSLLEAAEWPGRGTRCSPEAIARLREFVAEIRRLRPLAGQPIVDVITEVIATTGLDVEIEAGDAALAVARLANIHAFLDVAARFSGLGGEADLAAFLAFLRAAEENEDGLDLGAVSQSNTVKLMTVHAAKGLEWDIVAVPGLVEKVFPSDRARAAWTTAAHVLPFRCRGDADDLPRLGGYTTVDFDDFKAECRGDAADEERRLAYVAMTRARHELWLSSYAWSATRKTAVAVSPYIAEVAALSSVVVDGWCDDPDPADINPLLVAGVADVAWPAPLDPVATATRRAGADLVRAAQAGKLALPSLSGAALTTAQRWQRDSDLLLDEVRRRRVRTIEVSVPARLTTSQIVALARDPDGFAASLARPMPARPAVQARRGSRFHRWVEQLYGASPLIEPDDLPGASDADLSDAELEALQATFLAGGWGERRPVAVEAPFEMVIGGRLVRGRIDAVYLNDAGTLYETYDVIDYKTGAIPTGAELDAASLQLSVYRLAWADLAGVDPAVVTAGFLYVASGTVKRPDRLLDRDELGELLAGRPQPAE
jgi:DNA helicase-2/ATP-dependent DNA helicase PcrA